MVLIKKLFSTVIKADPIEPRILELEDPERAYCPNSSSTRGRHWAPNPSVATPRTTLSSRARPGLVTSNTLQPCLSSWASSSGSLVKNSKSNYYNEYKSYSTIINRRTQELI